MRRQQAGSHHHHPIIISNSPSSIPHAAVVVRDSISRRCWELAAAGRMIDSTATAGAPSLRLCFLHLCQPRPRHRLAGTALSFITRVRQNTSGLDAQRTVTLSVNLGRTDIPFLGRNGITAKVLHGGSRTPRIVDVRLRGRHESPLIPYSACVNAPPHAEFDIRALC